MKHRMCVYNKRKYKEWRWIFGKGEEKRKQFWTKVKWLFQNKKEKKTGQKLSGYRKVQKVCAKGILKKEFYVCSSWLRLEWT